MGNVVTRTANIQIVNNFFYGDIKTLTVTHKFGGTEKTLTWTDIKQNTVSSEMKQVTYQTGPATDWDFWKIEITLTNGYVWKNNGWKRCYLEARDDNTNGRCVNFEVSEGNFFFFH